MYTSVVTKDWFIYRKSQGTKIINNSTKQKYFLLKLVEILSAKNWLKSIKTFAYKKLKILFYMVFFDKNKTKIKKSYHGKK